MSMIGFRWAALAFALFLLPAGSHAAVIDLSGAWRFELDTTDAGVKERWFARSLADTITLPNSTDTAGKGKANGPGLAQAGRLTRSCEYTGPAWYQREIDIPSGWADRWVGLFLERVHWESRLWIDEQEIGMQDSLSAPHEFDLAGKLAPGRHRLTLRVDNSMKYPVGRWAHSVTDETTGNWNGIIGRIELRALEPAALENVRVGSDLAKGILWVDGRIHNCTTGQLSGVVSCVVRQKAGEPILLQRRVELAALVATNQFHLELPLDGKLALWDEFTPSLYLAEITLAARDGITTWNDTAAISFGVRQFSGRDGQFLINGRPTFLRGNLTGGEFPLTGHFPMDEAGWDRVIRVMKEYGLNHLRFHSHCPPEAAFAVADRLGFYFSPEAPFWTKLRGHSPQGQFLRAEALRMICAYGNHPSFVMMGLGNELGGDNAFFSSILRELKQTDPRRLYTCDVNDPGIGKRKSPIADCDFFVSRHTENGPLRLAALRRFNRPLAADGTDCDYTEAARAVNVPLVAHELGQWAVHPAGTEIPKYTGVMKPYNLEYFRRLLELRGMGDQATLISQASGRLAWQLYKEDMELCLRTPKFGGFQLLQLQDFPGQGDALVGLLDAFWETKGILTPEEFRGACSQTVPLVRMARFVWSSDETFEAAVGVAHYGRADIKQARVHWTLASSDGTFRKEETIAPVEIKQGTVTRAGNIRLPLAGLTPATQLKLGVGIEGTSYSNQWPVWVYPPNVSIAPPPGVLMAERFDDAVKTRLAAGGSVLLSLPAQADTDSQPRILRTRYETVFWSYLWRSTRNEGTMGILCDPQHPALKQFPTEFCSNWQWAELANDARAFVLNDTPADYHPIVQGIDDFHRAWKLGHIIEGRVGPGRIVLCGFDLHTDLNHRVVARQLRRSLLDYMVSADFKPTHALNLDQMFAPSLAVAGQVIFASSALSPGGGNVNSGVKKGKKGRPAKSAMDVVQGELDQFNQMTASAQSGNGAAAAFDLNWNSDWVLDGRNLPQEVQIDLGRATKLRGLLYKPSVNGANRVRQFEVYVSDDRERWGKPAGNFTALDNTKWFSNVLFDQPRTGRYLRIVVTAGFGGSPRFRVAEFEPLLE
jgi:beta-galactosidase